MAICHHLYLQIVINQKKGGSLKSKRRRSADNSKLCNRPSTTEFSRRRRSNKPRNQSARSSSSKNDDESSCGSGKDADSWDKEETIRFLEELGAGGTRRNAPVNALDVIAKTGISIENKMEQEKLQKHIMFKNDLISAAASARLAHPGPSTNALLAKKMPRRPFLSSKIGGLVVISDNIVIGSQNNAEDVNSLKAMGITHILDATHFSKTPFPLDSFIVKRLNVTESSEESMSEYAPSASEFIKDVEDCNARVLVFCVTGHSRAPAVVMWHFITTHRLALKRIYNHVESCDHCIALKDQYKLQLAEYELQFLGKSSVAHKGGKAWNFYEWNRVRRTLGRQKTVADSVAYCAVM